MNHPIKERLITDAELAEWLMVSKSTLHKLREVGDLPFRQIGTCIRYSVAEIEAWLNERIANPPKITPNSNDEHERQRDNDNEF